MGFAEDLMQGNIKGRFYTCSQTGVIYRVNESFETRSERFPEIKIPSIRADLYYSETGQLRANNLVKFISDCLNDQSAPRDFRSLE